MKNIIDSPLNVCHCPLMSGGAGHSNNKINMKIIRLILKSIAAVALIVAPAFFENKIVPHIEALIQTLSSNI